MALLHPELVASEPVRTESRARTAAWSTPVEFFVEQLASGVAQSAAAFYPRPVIVRFSDFKTKLTLGVDRGSTIPAITPSSRPPSPRRGWTASRSLPTRSRVVGHLAVEDGTLGAFGETRR